MLALLLAASHASAAEAEAKAAAPAAPAGATVVANYKTVFTQPPVNTPNRNCIDAPLLGNGDMLAAIGGSTDSIQFFINKNDLWDLGHMNSPMPLSRIVLTFPGFQDASYHVEQDLLTAVTTGRF